jgi:biopolymer transport protein TolR
MANNSGQGRNNRNYMSEINVTPLVDVVIVLLIIFMVAAPMMTKGLDVKLPQTTAKSLPQKKKNIVITVNDRGEIYLNKVAVDEEVLRRRLNEIRQEGQVEQVLLKADKALAYGVVAGVMTAIREAGVENLGLVTEPVENSSGKHKKI